MDYRVVYDVLDDGLGWGAPTILSATFFLTAFGLYMARRHGRGLPGQSAWRRPVSLLIPGCGVAAVVFAWIQVRMFLQQETSKEWARVGQYSVVEGAVSDYYRRQSTLRFQVGDRMFYCGHNDAGYRGTFTAPGAPWDALRNGVHARIARHDEYILRIEIAAEQRVAPEPAGR